MANNAGIVALPRLRPDQLAIAQHPAKIKVLTAGRRYGKTVLGGVIAINMLRQHGKVLWMPPTYKQSRPLWRWALSICAGHPAFKVNRAEKMIETSRGGLLAVYSGDNADAARGEDFDLAILDEASQLPEEVITDIVMPTLADRNGDALIITTPKGKNWVYQWWLKGQTGRDGIYSSQLPSSANPMPTIQDAVRKAEAMLPERSFRQEWLAEFLDDGGEVFRRVRENAVAVRQEQPIPGHIYGIGVDLGKRVDASVFTVMDITTRQEVFTDHMRGIDYTVQVDRLGALASRFRPLVIVVEVNSPGDVFCELARKKGMPILEFQTSNTSKGAIIESLMAAFEQDAIGIEDDAALVAELEAFSVERLPSGVMRYGAPAGMHDDRVMSLALAWYTVTQQYEPAAEVEYAEPYTFSGSQY
jgi:hypothetical protein